MAVINGYITVEALKEVLNDVSDADNSRYEMAIEAASRRIDRWCGESRHFWSVEAPEPRRFFSVNKWVTHPGFFSTTTGLIVKTDDDGNGIFETTWASSDWQAQTSSRYAGEAYDRIVATGARRWPVNGRRECIEITALWGWETVPAPVVQATHALAIALYKSKDFVDVSDVDAPDVATFAKKLIMPYASKRGPLFCDDHGNKDATPMMAAYK